MQCLIIAYVTCEEWWHACSQKPPTNAHHTEPLDMVCCVHCKRMPCVYVYVPERDWKALFNGLWFVYFWSFWWKFAFATSSSVVHLSFGILSVHVLRPLCLSVVRCSGRVSYSWESDEKEIATIIISVSPDSWWRQRRILSIIHVAVHAVLGSSFESRATKCIGPHNGRTAIWIETRLYKTY